MDTIDKIHDELIKLNGLMERLVQLQPVRRKPNKISPELSEACGSTWEAYSVEFSKRFGHKPVRNTTTNVHIKAFVKKLGVGEAPMVAAFYVGNSGQYYAKQLYPLNIMNRDAEKIRTMWLKHKENVKCQKIEELRLKVIEKETDPNRARQIMESLKLKVKGIPS